MNPYKIRKQAKKFLAIKTDTDEVINKFDTRENAESFIRLKIRNDEKKQKLDAMPKHVKRYDFSMISEKHIDPTTGFLVLPARATRTGVFTYRLADGTTFKEFRPPEEVFAFDSMKTFEGKPLTNGHPPELVTTQNAKKYMVGYTSDKVERDGEWITTRAFVTDEAAINDIQEGKQQLSCGYECDLELKSGDYMGEAYDAIQRNIRYNHLAIVDLARAGNEARLTLDNADGELIEENEKASGDENTKIPYEEVNTMVKVKIDGIEYEVEEKVSKELERLGTEVKSLSTKIDEKDASIKSLTKDRDSMEARGDALKADLETEKKKNSTKLDAAEIKTAAKARIELLETAKNTCDEETIAKLDSMEDLDIKKAIVKSKHSDINLDAKSEDYINAFVDAVRADLKEKDDTKNLGGEILKNRQDGTQEGAALIKEAKKKSMNEDLDAWKKPFSAQA